MKNILAGDDPRLLAVVGPCSIHDEKSGLEFAQRLTELARRVQDRVFVLMRVYFEKPRTTVGWKGLINDPHLDDTFDISEGLRIARRILLRIAEMGLPAATEMLEPITPQYIADLITLASIGARTTESPTHRQMASGLSMPVGYKNGTDGSLQVALDAMIAARTSACFSRHRYGWPHLRVQSQRQSVGLLDSARRPIRAELFGRQHQIRRRGTGEARSAGTADRRLQSRQLEQRFSPPMRGLEHACCEQFQKTIHRSPG